MSKKRKSNNKLEAREYSYPRIKELGMNITLDGDVAYVPTNILRKALRKHKITRIFNKYYGIQTAHIKGPYPWDVEAVLERIASGKLIGTQLIWD